jgi:DNA helicase MCM9
MNQEFYSIGKIGRTEVLSSACDWLVVHYYYELWKVMTCKEQNLWTAFPIDGMKLMATNQVLGNLLLLKSRETMKIFDEALIAAQNDINERLVEEKGKVHPRLLIRWYRLPNFSETYRSKIPKSIDANKLLMVRGTIVRAEAQKLIEWEVTYQCQTCHSTFVTQADLESYNHHPYPTSCGAATAFGAKKCASKKFNKISTADASNTRDYQELKLQEQLQHLNMSALPRSIHVVILDALVGLCNAGDEVTVTGLVTYRWGMLSMEEKPELELIILGTHLTVNNERRTSSSITDDVSREFSSFWQEYGSETPLLARDAMIRSICPEVYGMRNVKLAIAVILAGGVKIQNGSNSTRGDSHLLMVGDPGTGKSQLLRFAAKLASRSVLTTGVGTTGAGLTATAVRDNSGQWGLEAGALVLADGGACCIDEFSSIDKEQLVSIHEAMEQQIVHIAKAGIQCHLHTRCSVIAATNPKTKYNSDESISMNVAIASPILSRFDLVMVLQDECDDIWDKAISSFILKERNKGILRLHSNVDDMDGDTNDEEAQIQLFTRSAPQTPNAQNRMDTSPNSAHNRSLSNLDEETGSISAASHSMGMDHSISSRSGLGRGLSGPAALMQEPWGLEKLQTYLTWVKTSFQPRMSVEVQTIGTAYYKRQRQADDLDAARTTTRLAESFVRLTQGHAKIMARHTAVIQDAIVAILLLECSAASWILGGTRIPTVRSFFPIDPDAEYLEMEALILKHLGLSHLSSHPAPPSLPSTPLPPPRVTGDHGGIVRPPTQQHHPTSPLRATAPNSGSGGFFIRPPGSSSQSNAILNAAATHNPHAMETDFELAAMATDPRLPTQSATRLTQARTSIHPNSASTSQEPRNQARGLTSIPLVFDDSSQASSHTMWNARQANTPIASRAPASASSSQQSVVQQEDRNFLPAASSAPSSFSAANIPTTAYQHSAQHYSHSYPKDAEMVGNTREVHKNGFSSAQTVNASPMGMPDLVPLPPGMDNDFGIWEMQQTEDKALPLSIPASQMDLDEDFMM